MRNLDTRQGTPCAHCGKWHTLICETERAAAAERVRVKRALRRAGKVWCTDCGQLRPEFRTQCPATGDVHGPLRDGC